MFWDVIICNNYCFVVMWRWITGLLSSCPMTCTKRCCVRNGRRRNWRPWTSPSIMRMSSTTVRWESIALFIFSVNIFCFVYPEFRIVIHWTEVHFISTDMFSIALHSNQTLSFIQMLTSSLLELHQRKQICVHAFHLPRTERNNGALVDLIHIDFF